ncbi:MAG: class I SAM-dependent RNA methyltransferase [Lachnospiraceae bacterium]|nr:class I SAM-dependent RNA methyltransferase [Lachnospiraceae bacterium]
MKKGEQYIGKVRELIFPCKGIAVSDGVDVVIKNTLPGQEVSFILKKNKPGLKEGRLLEITKRAVNETNDGCPHSLNRPCDARCGGCSFQSLPYDEELKLKEHMVKDVILKALKQHESEAEEHYIKIYEGITGSPDPEGYRNKMEFSFGNEVKDGPMTLGMHVSGHFMDVIDTPECNIVDEDFRIIREAVLSFAKEKGMAFYHRYSNTGFLRNLLVRKGKKTGEIMVDIVSTSDGDIFGQEFTGKLLSLSLKGKIVSVLHTVNDSHGDAVKNEKTTIIYGRDHIFDEVLGLRFKISVFSFFQTNTLGAEILYERVRNYIKDNLSIKDNVTAGSSGEDKTLETDNHKAGVVYDLYSGTGTIAQLVSESADKVVGIEIVDEAVEAAKENADLNGIKNVEFLCGDVLKKLDEVDIKPNLIILDPPRDGVNPKALTRILDYGVENIVYISCKVTSLARDLHAFYEAGYRMQRVSVVDMFPRTANVETCCLLERLRNAKDHVTFTLDMEDYYRIKDAETDKKNDSKN